MSDGILTIEHGEVRLDNKIVPGILKEMNIAGEVRFDEAEQDAHSGKTKTPLGWKDSDISLIMQLKTDFKSNCYEKLNDLNAIFRGTDNGANPKVYDVVNAHVMARSIEQVVFSGLASGETNENDVILASLNFVEHIPPVVQKESQVAASDQAKGETPVVSEKEPEKDSEIMKDPFAEGFGLGQG